MRLPLTHLLTPLQSQLLPPLQNLLLAPVLEPVQSYCPLTFDAAGVLWEVDLAMPQAGERAMRC